MQNKLEKHQSDTEKVGSGITYRFNNFKNKQVLKSAEETAKIEKLLAHVKRLLRRREQLYKQGGRKGTP